MSNQVEVTGDFLVNMAQKNDILLYRAILYINKRSGWSENHKKFMNSLATRIEFKLNTESDNVLTSKQLEVARRIITHYGPLLLCAHHEKVEMRKERKRNSGVTTNNTSNDSIQAA